MVFMNMESFEEERIPRANIDKADFIVPEAEVTILRWQGKAIDVQLPKTVVLKARRALSHPYSQSLFARNTRTHVCACPRAVQVADTEPGAKGNSAGGRVEKPATLEGGATINVPIFIDIGEEVRVDTDDRKYLGRNTD